MIGLVVIVASSGIIVNAKMSKEKKFNNILILNANYVKLGKIKSRIETILIYSFILNSTFTILFIFSSIVRKKIMSCQEK